MYDYIKREWPYILGMWGAAVFFSLQTILILFFKFIYYNVSPFEFYPIVSIGFIIGAVLAALGASLERFKFTIVVFWLAIVISGILISFYSSHTWLFLYSFLLMLPLGFLLTSGFFLFNPKKFYKYELIGSFVGLITVFLFTSHISVELVLVIFLIVASIISLLFYRNLLSILMVLVSLSIGGLQLTIHKLNFMTYVADISLPNYENDIYKNGFQAIKAGKVDLLESKWSLGERIDVGRIRSNGKLVFYYNNTMWSEISSKDSFDQGILESFPNAKSLLDIGSGGGETLRQAINSGIKVVKGLEINSSIASLMTNQYRDYSGGIYDHVELIEGRKYLENSSEYFDLITIIKSSDKPNFIPNYLTVDYLSSKEGIKKIHERLSENGFVIWSSNIRPHSSEWIAWSIFGILDSVRKKNESDHDLLNRMVIFIRKNNISYDPTKSDILIILKKNKINLIDSKQFQVLIEKMGYQYIYGIPANGIFVPPVENQYVNSFYMAESKWLSDKRNIEMSLYNDERPFENIKDFVFYDMFHALKWYLLLIVIFIGAILLRSYKKETNSKLIVGGMTGFYYGGLGIFLIQKFERVFNTPMLSFIVVTFCLLLGSSVCSFLSRKNLRNKALSYIHPVFVVLLITFANSTPYILCFLILLTALSSSVPFISMLGELDNDSSDKKNIYLINILGYSLGMFFPLAVIVYYGNNISSITMLLASVTIPLMNYVVAKRIIKGIL